MHPVLVIHPRTIFPLPALCVTAEDGEWEFAISFLFASFVLLTYPPTDLIE